MNFIIEEIQPNLDELKEKVANKFGKPYVCKLVGKYIMTDEDDTFVLVGIDNVIILENYLVLHRETDTLAVPDEIIDVARINLDKNTVKYRLKDSRELVSIKDMF